MAENDWAIVIGINEYVFLPADDHLKYAVNDAVKMRQFLCEQAKFPQENVLLCCDSAPGVTPNQYPNRNGLRHLLKNEIQRAKGANNFWFFYAGHGIVHEHQDFLLPCDGNPNDLRETAIPIDFVTDCLRDCGADNVVLVLDMCRNRTRGTDEGSRGIGEVMGEQTQKIAKERGIVTLFSCSRDQQSYEIGDLEQGAFTYALLEGLKQSTTPRALEQYLTNRLPALNRQYGKRIQEPMVIPEPGWKYDRPLLLSCATPADIQQLAVEARDAELEEQDYEKAKVLWWQVIEADRSTQSDRAKARKAIDRINNSIKKAIPILWKLGIAQDDLSTDRNVDYSQLRDLLKAGNWKDADYETYLVMLKVVGREKGDRIMNSELLNFPCTDLRTIDSLWVKYSNGRFGFSLHKKLYLEVGNVLDDRSDTPEAVEKFGKIMGWKELFESTELHDEAGKLGILDMPTTENGWTEMHTMFLNLVFSYMNNHKKTAFFPFIGYFLFMVFNKELEGISEKEVNREIGDFLRALYSRIETCEV